jgi:hypothetical protein
LLSAIGPKQTCRKTQSMSLLGIKRTCRFALQMSAFDQSGHSARGYVSALRQLMCVQTYIKSPIVATPKSINCSGRKSERRLGGFVTLLLPHSNHRILSLREVPSFGKAPTRRISRAAMFQKGTDHPRLFALNRMLRCTAT